MKNCPNCGAALDPYSVKCVYCGSICLDFSCIDLEYNTPCYIRMKTPYGIVTTLATPTLGEVELTNETTDIYDRTGTILKRTYRTPRCEFHISFVSTGDSKDRLFIIEKPEEMENCL